MGEQFNFRYFLGGLSFFLYGMLLFQTSIKKIGSRYMKKLLQKRTKTPLKGILTGTITTAVLQSSSVVTLIVIGLVGVNMISFPNTIGIIIGTNIGSTITARFISIFGFKLNLQAIALPIIAITGLGMVFFMKKKKLHYSAILIFGFGLLLFGINFIKDSFGFLGSNFSLEQYLGIAPILFVFVGFFLTAAVQSTAISNTITFTAMSSGLISFKIGMIMVVGANIGTTVTAILGAINGNSDQKQVAAIHVFYNLATGIIILALINPIHHLLYNILEVQKDVIGLAIFHTFFNIIGAIIFLPFIKHTAKLIKKIIPDKKNRYELAIENTNPNEGETAILAVRQDIEKLCLQVMQFHLKIFHIKPQKILQKEAKTKEAEHEDFHFSKKDLKENYKHIKRIQSQLIKFSVQFESDQISEESLENLGQINHAIISFTQSSKMLKDIKNAIDDIHESDKEFLQKQFKSFKKRMILFYSEIYQIILNREDISETVKNMVVIDNHIKEQDNRYLNKMSSKIFKSGIFDIFKNNPNSTESHEIITINNYIYEANELLLNGIKNRILTLDEIQQLKQEQKDLIDGIQI